jgi:hypothetical protein
MGAAVAAVAIDMMVVVDVVVVSLVYRLVVDVIAPASPAP